MKVINLKKIINEENKTKIIGILTILLLLWVIIYFIPETFVLLFNTGLGFLILVTTIVLVSMYNYKEGIILGILLIIFYRFIHLTQTTNVKEGFQWSNEDLSNFLWLEETIHPDIIFDPKIIEKQVTKEELDYFIKNGHWPWTPEVEQLYRDASLKNPYIRTLPQNAVFQAKRIYNQNAILQILSFQTKEGQFLLNGVLVKDPSGNKAEDLPSGYGNFGYESGLIGPLNKDIIKCNIKNIDNASLEKITYTGKGGLFIQQTKKVTPLDYHDLEEIVPGFSFINGPCDPCTNLTPNKSCPFDLKVKNTSTVSSLFQESTDVSPVWKYIWNI
jgi:hypothetical protein